MSTTREASLADRRNELTRRLILDTAVDLLESGGVRGLTMRAVAKRGNMSERTVFRYFATRDEFLDAVTAEARSRMALPPAPRTIAELQATPRLLYEALEAHRSLVIAALHSEIVDRIREGAARTRWTAIRHLIDEQAPRRTLRERKLATTSICFYLGATCWHFHRFTFKMTLDETIDAAETATRLALDSLGIRHR